MRDLRVDEMGFVDPTRVGESYDEPQGRYEPVHKPSRTAAQIRADVGVLVS